MIPLYYSLPAQGTLWLRIIPVSQRDRECTWWEQLKQEEDERRFKPKEKNPLWRDQDLNPWNLSPEPSALSARTWRPDQATVVLENFSDFRDERDSTLRVDNLQLYHPHRFQSTTAIWWQGLQPRHHEILCPHGEGEDVGMEQDRSPLPVPVSGAHRSQEYYSDYWIHTRGMFTEWGPSVNLCINQ